VEEKQMATKKGSSKKSSSKKGASKKGSSKKGSRRRELIDTGKNKLYVRRDEKGRFDDVADVGRSLAQDIRRKAKNEAPSGQGDRGDRKR
jgi:hypothetical protein